MVQDTSDATARARAALADYSGDQSAQWDIAVLHVTPRHYRGGRVVLRATSGGARIIVKCYVRDGRAGAVFDLLAKRHNAHAGSVAPLHSDPARNLVLMADAGAQNLADTLATHPPATVLTSAMRTLAALQQAAPPDIIPFDATALLAEKALQFDYVPPPHNRHCATLLQAMQDRFAPFQDRRLPHVLCHGDFKPLNLCHDGDLAALTLIDPVEIPAQPPEYDAALFLDWVKVHGWGQRLRAGHAVIRAPVRPFYRPALAAFDPPLDPALLAAFAYSFAVDKWVKMAMHGDAPDLQRTIEVELGLRHRLHLLRPFLRRGLRVFGLR